MGINLEIGSGCNPQPGYIHCDTHRDINCPSALDIVCDARAVPLDSGSCDSILMFGVFEHFGYYEVQEVLLEVWRLLREGGTFKFDVPDFDWFVEAYRTRKCSITGNQIDPIRDDMWFMKSFYGGQDTPGMFHKWMWNQKRLEDFLAKPNWRFSSFKLIGRQWRDPEPNHLIYEVIK